MSIYEVKVYDKNGKLNKSKSLNQKEAEAHFYRDALPSKTIRSMMKPDHPERMCIEEGCKNMYKPTYVTQKYCRSEVCKYNRKKRHSAEQYLRKQKGGE